MDERREVASVRWEYSLFGKSRNSVKEIERLVELEWEKFQTRYTNKVALVMVCFGIKCFSLIKTDETWHTHTHKGKKACETNNRNYLYTFIHSCTWCTFLETCDFIFEFGAFEQERETKTRIWLLRWNRTTNISSGRRSRVRRTTGEKTKLKTFPS